MTSDGDLREEVSLAEVVANAELRIPCGKPSLSLSRDVIGVIRAEQENRAALRSELGESGR
jgi:hypothetical protein